MSLGTFGPYFEVGKRGVGREETSVLLSYKTWNLGQPFFFHGTSSSDNVNIQKRRELRRTQRKEAGAENHS